MLIDRLFTRRHACPDTCSQAARLLTAASEGSSPLMLMSTIVLHALHCCTASLQELQTCEMLHRIAGSAATAGWLMAVDSASACCWCCIHQQLRSANGMKLRVGMGSLFAVREC
jgi:hypothetical protein